MPPATIPDAFARYTLERYETGFADRHLLHGVIAKWARERPDRAAIIDAETGRSISYGRLDEITTAWALQLVDMGFRKGDFLATMLPLLPKHICLEYACFKIGVIHAPLDVRLKAAEVVRSLELIQAKGFALPGKSPADDATDIGRTVRDQCPFIEHFLQFAPVEEDCGTALGIEEFARRADAPMRAAQADGEPSSLWSRYRALNESIEPTDGAQVIYTTGSTGLPKPALLSHRNITSRNMCLAAGFEMDDAPRQLVNLPASHVGCQAEQLMTTFFAGGTAVILHVFDAEKSLKAIQDYAVDVFGQIPAMFQLQWRLSNYGEFDLSSVRKALFGGQTVTRQFVDGLARMVPRFGTGLGLSEMSGFVTYTGLTDRVDDVVDCVGWPMPITPLSIRQPMNDDGTAGDELPFGETGDICFSGPQVFVEYVNAKDAYRRTVSSEGICYTGDLGYRSERGLVFCGRAKLVIKPKGYQVHPAQIEDHFAMLKDQVAVCGVVGASHEIFGEGVMLFAELKPGATLTSGMLQEHAKGIAAFMRPLHYILLEPGSFPLNRIAKTDYVRLQEMAQAEAQKLHAQGKWDRDDDL